MFFELMINVYTIKFTFYFVLGIPLPLLAMVINILLRFIDATIFKVVKSINKRVLGSLYLLLLQVRILFDISGSTIVRTKILVISNLDRRVVSTRILSLLGSILVQSFAATMVWYLSVSFYIISPDGISMPISQ